MQKKQPKSGAKAQNQKKLRVGWFSFSCCEDNVIVFTEIMNDYWQEWIKVFDFRHVRALRTENVLDELDIAFIEGAITSENDEKKLKEIRVKSKKLVAVGACAVVGMPAGQRNYFDEKQRDEIKHLVAHFAALPKVLKVSEVVKIDAEVGGCPMDPDKFLAAVHNLVAELKD